MRTYLGVLEGANDNWGVWIADVPGCVGAGPTAEAARQDAAAALRIWLELAVEAGESLPAARTETELKHDLWVAEALDSGGALVSVSPALRLAAE